jgi:ABC-2 type transport system ATP-binding protein
MNGDILLQTVRLSRRFGPIEAVSELDMTVRAGDIYGFLGLNGAGKTTTIRMAVGLVRPTSGRVFLFGRDLAAARLEALSQIGALVELPAFYPYLTGRENLEVLARVSGGVRPGRIDEVLRRVGLFDRAGDPVRAYSQGMRQRLGIAQAILSEPRLVLLDEPTNGLDPQGIADIRALIRELNRERGTTFLISSHLLHEVELVCTRVGIIRAGRMVREGPVDELLASGSDRVRLRAHPAGRAEEILRGAGGCEVLDRRGDGALELRAAPARLAELNALLVRAGISVSELSPNRLSLEEYFLTLD